MPRRPPYPRLTPAGARAIQQQTPPGSFLARRFLTWCAGPHTVWAAALLAACFTAPSLCTGYIQDDHFFRVILEGRADSWNVERGPLDTFVFSAGAGDTAQLKAQGILPWWTPDDWRLKFSRPVASLSHFADFALFGDRPFFMHLHNLILMAVVVMVVATVFRRFMPRHPLAAGLATLFYALDACHGIPVGWISHRNSMYAELFGLLALLAHHGARGAGNEKTWPREWILRGLAGLCFLLSLLSGEIGIAMLGYFAAHALFLDRRASQPHAFRPVTAAYRCWSALWIYGALIVAWRIVYDYGHYGASGSGFYVDPMGDTGRFTAQLLEYFPVLFTAVFTGPDSMLYSGWDPPWQTLHYLLGVTIFALSLAMLLPGLKRSPLVRFWFCGVLMSIVPLCATMPTDRLIVIPALGGMALIALFASGVLARAPWVPAGTVARRVCRIVAPALIVIHLVISPFVLTMNAMSMALMGRMLDSLNRSVPMNALQAGERVIVLNTPLDIAGASLPIFALAEYGVTTPTWTYLHAGAKPVTVTRVAENTIRIDASEGYFSRPWSMLFCNPWRLPYDAGASIAGHGFTAHFLDSEQHGIFTSAEFEFDEPLDSSRVHWMTYDDGRYVPVDLPDIGQSRTVGGLESATLMRMAGRLCATRTEPTTGGTNP